MYMSKMANIISTLEAFKTFDSCSGLDEHFLDNLIPYCKTSPLFLTDFNDDSPKGDHARVDSDGCLYIYEDVHFPFPMFFLENTNKNCLDGLPYAGEFPLIDGVDTTRIPLGCFVTVNSYASGDNIATLGFSIGRDGSISHEAFVTIYVDGEISYKNIDYMTADKEPTKNRIMSSMYFMLQVKNFLDVLNCKNITTLKTNQTKKINNKRIAKGKKPFYSYHELVVKGTSKASGLVLGGSHASPRLHMRRGHVRRLHRGGTTFVSPCIVGNKSLGAVGKQYVMKNA